MQSPTGFAAFPDGAASRVLRQGMLVYVCSALTEPLHFLGFVPQPDRSLFNVDVRVLSWNADGFDVAFRAYDAQPPVFSAFHILTAGGTRSLGMPADTIQASQVIAPACQHTLDSLTLSGRRRGLYDRP
jgi:hypothetical protein